MRQHLPIWHQLVTQLVFFFTRNTYRPKLRCLQRSRSQPDKHWDQHWDRPWTRRRGPSCCLHSSLHSLTSDFWNRKYVRKTTQKYIWNIFDCWSLDRSFLSPNMCGFKRYIFVMIICLQISRSQPNKHWDRHRERSRERPWTRRRRPFCCLSDTLPDILPDIWPVSEIYSEINLIAGIWVKGFSVLACAVSSLIHVFNYVFNEYLC